MLAVNVGDDGEDGPQLQKRAVTFVGLGDEVLGLADAGIGADGVNTAADDDRGVEPSGGEHGGDHRGGGGLAMHAGDGDAVLEAHQFGEHFGTGDYRNVAGVGGGDFGVVACDGGTGDDDVSAGDVFGAMALEGERAECGEAMGDGRGLEVRAGNLIAEVQQDLGDAAHADAADAYEMNALNFGEHGVAVSRQLSAMSKSNDADFLGYMVGACDASEPGGHGCDFGGGVGVGEVAG